MIDYICWVIQVQPLIYIHMGLRDGGVWRGIRAVRSVLWSPNYAARSSLVSDIVIDMEYVTDVEYASDDDDKQTTFARLF